MLRSIILRLVAPGESAESLLFGEKGDSGFLCGDVTAVLYNAAWVLWTDSLPWRSSMGESMIVPFGDTSCAGALTRLSVSSRSAWRYGNKNGLTNVGLRTGLVFVIFCTGKLNFHRA